MHLLFHLSFIICFRLALPSGKRFLLEVEDRVIISFHFPTLRRHSARESSNGNGTAEEMAIRLQRGRDGGLIWCLKQLLSVIIHESGLNILDSSKNSRHMYNMYIQGTMSTCFEARRMENRNGAISTWNEMQISVFTANLASKPPF